MLSGNVKNGPRSLFRLRDMKAQTSMRSKNEEWAKNRLSPKTLIPVESLLGQESE